MSAKTIDELNVIISANASKFSSEMNAVKAQLGEVSKATAAASGAFKQMSIGAIAMGGLISGAISKAFGAMASQVGGAISRLDTLNNFPRVMSNLGISADDAQKSIDYMSEKLKGLPTTLNDGVMAVQRFTSANNDVQASTQMFLALNNALLAGGASAEVQAGAMEQISQAYAKGKPDMVEWRSMLTAMPAQAKQIAMAMDFADSTQLGEALRSGKVSMDDFMATVVRLNREGVAGFENFDTQARNATGGVGTSIANLRSAIQRGIADILNAIGQANIAGFFQRITNAINAVIPYVVAFVKVVLMAVGALRALFGGGKGSSGASGGGASSSGGGGVAGLSNGLSDASDSAGDLAKNAGGAGKKLGGATKQAKKLADQLAGFDEMTVLKMPDSSDSGGGGGGSGGGGGGGGAGGGGANASVPDFGSYGDDLGKVGNKVDELVQKFKDFFNNLWDFEKIGNALRLFWADMKVASRALGTVFSDIWSSYIKPVISWAGNNLLPAFLNAVGGAARFAGAFIKEAYFMAKPFIDKFIVPIVSKLGDALVSKLNKIGDSLRNLAMNPSALQSLVKLATTMGVLGGALALGSKVNAFNTSISSMNKILRNGGKDAEVLRSSLSKLQLAFVSAGGGVSGFKSAISTVAGSISGALSGAMNGLGSILSSVGGAFKSLWAVISANPIMAVVAVIAALILSNEELRTALISLITTALKPFEGVFDTLTGVIGRVADMVSGVLSMAFAALAPAVEGILRIFQSLSPVVEVLAGLFSASLSVALNLLGGAIQVVVAAVGVLVTVFNGAVSLVVQILTPAFEFLGAVFGKIKEWVDKLVSVMPNWLQGLLGVKDSGDKVNETSGQMIEKNKELKASTEELIEVEKIQAGVRESLAGLNASLIDQTENINQKLLELGGTTQLSADEWAELARKLESAHSLEEQMEIASRVLGITLDKENKEHNKLIESATKLGKTHGDLSSATTRAKITNESLTKAMNDTRFSNEKAQKSFVDIVAAHMRGELSATQLARKLENLAMEGDDSANELRQAIERNADAFGDTWKKAQEEMARASDSSKSKIQTSTNSMAQNVLQSASKMGQGLQQNSQNAHRAVEQSLMKIPKAGQRSADGVNQAFRPMGSNFTQYGAQAAQGFENGGGRMGQIGRNWANDVAANFKAGLDIHSPSRVFKKLGRFTGEGFALGIEDEQKAVQNALSGLTEGFSPMIDFEIADLPSDDLSRLFSTGKIAVDFEKDLDVNLSKQLEDLAKKPIALTVNVGSEKMLDQVIDGINGRNFLTGDSVFDF